MEQYFHHHLGQSEIRLFRIEDAEQGSPNGALCTIKQGAQSTTLPVMVTIVITALRDAPQYDALSYVWGNPIRNCYLVLCDGTSVPITRSIAEAVPFLLNTRRTGYLWIDQVCINQSDIEELNEQVSIMGSIYNSASCVLVWLGTGFEGADRVDDLFRVFEEAKYETGEEEAYEKFRSWLIHGPRARTNRNAVLTLMGLPWFRRAWVVQEFALARDAKILLGRFQWHPDLVFLITCRMRDFGREADSGYSASELAYLRENHPFQIIWNVKSTKEALFSLLSRMAGRSSATDHRDHVYAFLSLNRDERIHIQPDYRLPVREVFVNTAKQIMAGTRNLDILSTLPREPMKTKDQSAEPLNLPSWVPDWRCKASSLPLFYRHSRNRFAASGTSHFTLGGDEPPGSLRLQRQKSRDYFF